MTETTTITTGTSTPSGGRAHRVALRTLSAAAVLTLVAACGSSNDDSKSAAAGSDPGTSSSQFPGKKASGSPIKIGIINAEGGAAISMPEARAAAQAAATYANDNLGGIGGHVIKTVPCKTQEDPASTRACANQMVQDGVAAVVVPSTGNGDSMAPIITKAGIPYVSITGQSTSELTSKDAFMWTGGFPGLLAGMAKYSAQKGYKKVTVFVVDVPAAIGGAKQLGIPTFKAAGIALNVVGITPGTPDSTPQVSAGLTDHPDAAIVVNEANGCTSTLKALTILSPSIPKMMIQPCLDPTTTAAVGAGMNDAKVFTVSDTVSGDAENKLFLDVMKKYAPGTATAGFAVAGYQGMLALVRATAGMTGEPVAASVVKAIKSAKDIPLPAGHGITFTCDGKAFPGLSAVCGTGNIVLTVKNGVGTDPQLVG